MIWFWLILLAVVYVVMAIVVGKICAINSRWERTVDRLDPIETADEARRRPVGRLSPRLPEGPRPLLTAGHASSFPVVGGQMEGEGN